MATGNPADLCVGIVDDDESLRRSVARLLRAAGMRPLTYASAEEFCARLTEQRFDCLVFDIELPGMSGIDLRNELAAAGVATPVLFVTAHDDPKAREAALAGPCSGFFQKTDPGNELLSAIRRVILAGADGR